jgi:hypothetical protein
MSVSVMPPADFAGARHDAERIAVVQHDRHVGAARGYVRLDEVCDVICRSRRTPFGELVEGHLVALLHGCGQYGAAVRLGGVDAAPQVQAMGPLVDLPLGALRCRVDLGDGGGVPGG